MEISIKELTQDDVMVFHQLLDCFAQAFDQEQVYGNNRPGAEYLSRLLVSKHFIALVAMQDQRVIAGLTAYELPKFEQERSEIYIYDLAVAKEFRRRGIATQLIDYLKNIAQARGAWVIFVQADLEDTAAVQLYSKLGIREDVLHFDIAVK